MAADLTPPNTEQDKPETNKNDQTGHKNDVGRHAGRRLHAVLGLSEATDIAIPENKDRRHGIAEAEAAGRQTCGTP